MEWQFSFHNADNISRTKMYDAFARKFPEIRYARLAGLISRNTGWAMTDLLTKKKRWLSEAEKKQLAWIYEQISHLIFYDTYYQLSLYSRSKRKGQLLLDAMSTYGVSIFMQQEWLRFWEGRDEIRLLHAAIIHAQFMIQHRLLGQLPRQLMRIWAKDVKENGIDLPTSRGPLYHIHMKQVHDPTKRVKYLKQTASLLYHPHIEWGAYRFLYGVEPTGSRRDYLSCCNQGNAWPLRISFPKCKTNVPVKHTHYRDWYGHCDVQKIERLFRPVSVVPKMYMNKSRKQ
ncbi:DUF2515 family protein [Bacillus sp. FSL W7-1360]